MLRTFMARVLVIEDELQVRRIVRQMLVHDGHEVIEAGDGVQGIACVRACRPHLVITDIVMPEKEGLETISQLRRDEPDLPILVMSGDIEAALYLRMAELMGAYAALAKPFNIVQLRGAVDRLLPSSRPAA
jgi:CheY-like chemotaxis protein